MGKGSEWERKLCKDLSKWVQGTIKPYVYWRSSGSGSVFTKDHLTGTNFAGDINCILPQGEFLTNIFVIEAKNGYPSGSLDKHLKYNKSDCIKEFWLQVSRDAIQTNKLPMLIYNKKGLSCPWVGISKESFEKLKNFFDIRFVMLYFPELDQYNEIYLFSKKEFFECITPQILKEKFNEN